ncbi:hypothetical protein Nepgr_029606 [Nepenthes gracilis]|uniref:Uncharacterized protein n=1 Tax=Nepenthes gracilis TaxID=150966 RepID=A0AAD3Y3E4_NEPGR|nr:hypothetical protein Nepgr_029606 [Nepenthes gracilis]
MVGQINLFGQISTVRLDLHQSLGIPTAQVTILLLCNHPQVLLLVHQLGVQYLETLRLMCLEQLSHLHLGLQCQLLELLCLPPMLSPLQLLESVLHILVSSRDTPFDLSAGGSIFGRNSSDVFGATKPSSTWASVSILGAAPAMPTSNAFTTRTFGVSSSYSRGFGQKSTSAFGSSSVFGLSNCSVRATLSSSSLASASSFGSTLPSSHAFPALNFGVSSSSFDGSPCPVIRLITSWPLEILPLQFLSHR